MNTMRNGSWNDDPTLWETVLELDGYGGREPEIDPDDFNLTEWEVTVHRSTTDPRLVRIVIQRDEYYESGYIVLGPNAARAIADALNPPPSGPRA
jgi:hypothetical protein